jgi:hypothetical protein
MLKHALTFLTSLALPALVLAGPAAASFGIEKFESQIVANEAGVPATQAGSHPYSATFTIAFNDHKEAAGSGSLSENLVPDGDPKKIAVSLPQGLIVDPTAPGERCTEGELVLLACPSSSAVGVLTGVSKVLPKIVATVYDMVPPPGVAADFGANPSGLHALVHVIGKAVHAPGGYVLTGEVSNITQRIGLDSSTLTLFGVTSSGRPLLTMPTSCGGPLTATLGADSWQEPATLLEKAAFNHDGEGNPVDVTGCEKLAFSPSLSVQSETEATSSPSGFNVDLKVPQEESMEGLAEANLKDAVVTLPAGLVVNPAAAGGLQACTEAQIAIDSDEPAGCPAASKLGSVKVITPLLEHPLGGSLYLAQQGTDPFRGSLTVYLVLEGSGLVIKVPGEVRLDPATGQLTTTFKESPEVPFSEFRLEVFGGQEAALTMPSACGTYTATSSLTPYSAPESGPPATPNASFEIDQGCHGAQFSPTFTAGTGNNQAAGFGAFALTLSREDPEEDLGGIQVQMPPGLSAVLSGVPLCGEPQAASGECGSESQIGHVTAGAGAGSDPFYVTGRVFLTGPYGGAPFGLSIVVPAIAGPFNLGNVVVRAAINVDPHTAAVTVTSGPLPQIIEGVPLQVRKIDVSIDRERFIFNPTSCNPTSVDAKVSSAQGASAEVSSRYQAAGCGSLSFHPQFKVSTSGHTSRANGASLDTKLTFPAGANGTQANIAKVKVELPKQLPSRLTTLQKACTAAIFESNPAGCPAASVVGIAKATTPILPVQLTGPVYFVSHGGEAFPELDVVLQGYGIRVDLVGSTFISKKGITSSTFKSVPDVPVSSFELYLPEGRYSALAANGNLCTSSLAMPTTFTAQNGAVFTQSTKIAVSGCKKNTAGAARHKRKGSHQLTAAVRKAPRVRGRSR